MNRSFFDEVTERLVDIINLSDFPFILPITLNIAFQAHNTGLPWLDLHGNLNGIIEEHHAPHALGIEQHLSRDIFCVGAESDLFEHISLQLQGQDPQGHQLLTHLHKRSIDRFVFPYHSGLKHIDLGLPLRCARHVDLLCHIEDTDALRLAQVAQLGVVNCEFYGLAGQLREV